MNKSWSRVKAAGGAEGEVASPGGEVGGLLTSWSGGTARAAAWAHVGADGASKASGSGRLRLHVQREPQQLRRRTRHVSKGIAGAPSLCPEPFAASREEARAQKRVAPLAILGFQRARRKALHVGAPFSKLRDRQTVNRCNVLPFAAFLREKLAPAWQNTLQ